MPTPRSKRHSLARIIPAVTLRSLPVGAQRGALCPDSQLNRRVKMDEQGISPEASTESLRGELLEETQALRRKVNFWRKIAGFMVGVIVLVLLVSWQRGREGISLCRDALEQYAQLALSRKLDREATEVLETQWRALPMENKKLSPGHYSVIVRNWHIQPKPGETVPLAICESPHQDLFSRGRHVLERDVNGLHTRWISEDAAAPILREVPPSTKPIGLD